MYLGNLVVLTTTVLAFATPSLQCYTGKVGGACGAPGTSACDGNEIVSDQKHRAGPL